MVVVLDVDLLPMIERVVAVLDDYDPVTQQKVLEVVSVRHAMKMGSVRDADFVVVSMHKHITQMLRQLRQWS